MGLFKYYDDAKFNLVFKEGRISMRLSQVDALNDPFEAKLDIESALKKLLRKYKTDNLPKDKNNLIKETIKNQTKDSEIIFSEYVNNSFGILSLTTNNLNRLMWSHYTNSYKGFCVELDIDHDAKKIITSTIDGYRCHTKKVNYIEKVPEFKPEISNLHNNPYIKKPTADSLFGLYIINILSLKDSIWEYEDEYRVIGLLSEKKSDKEISGIPLFTINFAPIKIKQIIFGTACSDENINKVREWIVRENAHHIKLSRVVMHGDNYSLYTEPLTLVQSDAQSTHRQGRITTKYCINIHI